MDRNWRPDKHQAYLCGVWPRRGRGHPDPDDQGQDQDGAENHETESACIEPHLTARPPFQRTGNENIPTLANRRPPTDGGDMPPASSPRGGPKPKRLLTLFQVYPVYTQKSRVDLSTSA